MPGVQNIVDVSFKAAMHSHVVTAQPSRQQTPPALGRTSEPSFSKSRGAHTTIIMGLERNRRDLSIDACLGVCPLPMVEQISSEIRPRGWVSCLALLYGMAPFSHYATRDSAGSLPSSATEGSGCTYDPKYYHPMVGAGCT